MTFDEKLKTQLPYLFFVSDQPTTPGAEIHWDFVYKGKLYTIAHRPILKMFGLWTEPVSDTNGFSGPNEVFASDDLLIVRIRELYPPDAT